MAGAGGIYLNLRERAVFSENRERLEKNLIVRAGGPIGEVVDHKIGAEEVGPIAAGSIALRGAGQIELRRLEEIMFELETSAERVLCIFPDEGAEEVWPHASVQVLADLERDFDFFREWRRDVLGYLILRQIETGVGRKISDAECRASLDLNARS